MSIRKNMTMLLLPLAVFSAIGQTHFTFTSKTGNYMPVAIDSSIHPLINGMPLSNGDEIGVFSVDSADSPKVLCAGAVVWRGVNCAITVWGDDDQTAVKDGMHAGDTLIYRVWDSSLAIEIPAAVTYASGGPTYNAAGFSVLASLIAPPLPQKPRLVSPATATAINVDSAVFIWLKGAPLIDKYALEIGNDSLMSSVFHVDSSMATDTTSSYKGFTGGTYWWHVKAHNGSGWGSYSTSFKLTVNTTSVVSAATPALPFGMTVRDNRVISYSLSTPEMVSIRLYDLQGKLLRSLCDSYQPAGPYRIETGRIGLSKGVYLLSFHAGEVTVRKNIFNY